MRPGGYSALERVPGRCVQTIKSATRSLGSRAQRERAPRAIARWRADARRARDEGLACTTAREHPKEGATRVRPEASSGVEIVDREASPSSQHVVLWILQAWDSTGAVRPFSGAIGSEQAPSAARAVRLQGPQTGARRAGGRTRQGHWVRGREAKNAPELAGEDVVVARRPTEDSNLAPPSYAGGVPPWEGQIHESGQAQSDLGVPPWSIPISCWARAHHA